MNFTEFKRKLGAEPRSSDPEFVAARNTSPEYRQAAAEAERFEQRLESAFDITVPTDLVEGLLDTPGRRQRRARWPLALAASLVVSIGAAGLIYRSSHSWDSVEAYVLDHYRHDGAKVLELAAGGPSGDIQEILGAFGLQAEPALAGMVRLVKFCPAPGGRGAHMVLDTESGPVTVLYLPGTRVNDRQMIDLDGRQAMLVSLEHGAAVIVGGTGRSPAAYYAVVHDAIVPLDRRS